MVLLTPKSSENGAFFVFFLAHCERLNAFFAAEQCQQHPQLWTPRKTGGKKQT